MITVTLNGMIDIRYMLLTESLQILYNASAHGLKRGYIEFGVVCIHSAILQLLLTRRVSYFKPGGVRPEWIASA